MEQTMQQRRRRRAFTDSFKAEVVELCRNGDRPVAEVARELDLTETAVRRWVHQAEIDAGQRPGLTSSEREELVRLRKVVAVSLVVAAAGELAAGVAAVDPGAVEGAGTRTAS